VKWTSTPRTADWKKQIFCDVANDPALGPILKQRLEEKTLLARRYLREQGLAEPVPCGLVDCGWSGTWTDILGDLVTTEGGRSPLIFFLGRRKRTTPSRCETLAWMFDHQAGSGLKAVPEFFHVVIEFLLTANHGRTIGFEEIDGRLQPKLAAVDWQGFTPEDWRIYRRALLGYAELYARQLRANEESTDLRTALNELLVLFWEQPSMEEAHFFAGHTIGLSPTRANTKTLAQPYGWDDALRLAGRWRLPGHPPFWWHEGAQALSGPVIRKSMGLMWELRELIRAIRDHRAGLDAKRLAQLLTQSARKLNHVCARREENDSCRFINAYSAELSKPFKNLTAAASAGTRVS